MHQRFLIATIAGKAAETIRFRFERWLGLPEDSEALAKELKRFLKDLRANADLPPVLFCCEYVDMWSMGDLFNQAGLKSVMASNLQVACHPLPDGGKLIRHVEQWLRGGTQFDEQRWFGMVLREATARWQKLWEKAAVVVVRQVIGATVQDEVVKASLMAVPEWLQR